jgi:hypothetical protein
MDLRRKIWIAAAALVAICACNTPSVPIPPPVISALNFTQPMDGQVVVTGKPESRHANAQFFILNRSTGSGVITTAAADGSFTSTPFAGQMNDTLQMSYETPAGELSESVCALLQFNLPLISSQCP